MIVFCMLQQRFQLIKLLLAAVTHIYGSLAAISTHVRKMKHILVHRVN